jgi:Fe-S cluster assembly iron-binding protein IscA
VGAVLTLTDSAVQAVRGIVSSSEETPDTGGLRLVAGQTDDAPSFELSVAALPAEDDEVVEDQGARLFLDQKAASLLDDKVLDATIDAGNRVAFTVGPQQ